MMQRSLPRLLRTNAFRLAALYLTLFATSVLSLLAFIYFSTADFIERQTEATLDAELTGLSEQYEQRGLTGLVQIIAERSVGDRRSDETLYLVANSSYRPIAGNLPQWPEAEEIRPGWISFPIEVKNKGVVERHPARATTFDPTSWPPRGRSLRKDGSQRN